MNRREFIIQAGAALLAVPAALSLASCGNDNGDTAFPFFNPGGGTGFDVANSPDATGHSHSVRVLTSHHTSPPAGGVVYTSNVAEGHSHTIALTQQHLANIDNDMAETVTSSQNDGHTHNWTIRKP